MTNINDLIKTSESKSPKGNFVELKVGYYRDKVVKVEETKSDEKGTPGIILHFETIGRNKQWITEGSAPYFRGHLERNGVSVTDNFTMQSLVGMNFVMETEPITYNKPGSMDPATGNLTPGKTINTVSIKGFAIDPNVVVNMHQNNIDFISK